MMISYRKGKKFMRKWQFVNLNQIVGVDYSVFAHTDKSRPKETLQEHTGLCQKYWMKMYEARESDDFFAGIAQQFSLTNDAACEQLFHEMLDNVITFHDTGKMNPEFQKQNMRNSIPKLWHVAWLQGTNHSMFSAAIYLNHFIAKIDEYNPDKEIKRNLKGICFINAYVISRHHSNLSNMSVFINEFREGGSGDFIMEGLKENPNFLRDERYGKSRKYENMWAGFCRRLNQEKGIVIYIYARFLYSLLVSCDYYATTEYSSGVSIKDFGSLDEKDQFVEMYEDSELVQRIRSYEDETKTQNLDLKTACTMNLLRNEIFLEVEANLKENMNAGIYFLEAPTGSGKSNASMNLSFQLLKSGYRKIYYVYPFNTLVDQNLDSLKKIFGKESKAFQKIAVLNSNTPIKVEEDSMSDMLTESYQKALLNRQFLNYPFILTTHVSLFQTMFGSEREAIFGFSQLQNSVIVLDEIQSYKNAIWSEIIIFLKAFARQLNIKIIIMSATLPNLDYLTHDALEVVQLLKRRDDYFMNPLFKERVEISYDLLEQSMELELLKEHLIKYSTESNKIVIEFIKKKRAYEFMDILAEDERIAVPLYFISGDDNRADRMRILQDIRSRQDGLILVATQVIEAGVDIDMDIGYKDISKLDSEEQFLGRINRSCGKNCGKVFFFDLDDARKIYSDGDLRMNLDFTLLRAKMRDVLESKNFNPYYSEIMKHLQADMNCSFNNSKNLDLFFQESVQALNFPKVAERMKLIEDSNWDMSVYLARDIEVENEQLSGTDIWEQYKTLLQDYSMEYSEKQVKLSEVTSKMNYFIYQIKKNSDLCPNDKVGEIYYIEDGECFFVDGRLDRKKLESEGGLFLGWE